MGARWCTSAWGTKSRRFTGSIRLLTTARTGWRGFAWIRAGIVCALIRAMPTCFVASDFLLRKAFDAKQTVGPYSHGVAGRKRNYEPRAQETIQRSFSMASTSPRSGDSPHEIQRARLNAGSVQLPQFGGGAQAST